MTPAADGGPRRRSATRALALVLAVLATTAVIVPFVGVGAAQVGPPVAACEVSEPFPEPGEDVTLDASASRDGEYYRYDVEGDGTYDALTTSATFQYAYGGGTYEPRVQVRNSAGTDEAACGTVVVAPNTPPKVALDYDPAEPVVGEQVSFSVFATDNDGSIAGYAWYLDGSPVLVDGSEWTRRFKSAGTYNVTVRVTDDDGDSTRDTVLVTVTEANDPPEPSLTVSPVEPLVGESVTLDASGSSDPDGTVVFWEFDADGDGTYDRASETDGVVTYAYAEPGAYTARVLVTDDDGDSAEATATVTVRAPNEAPTAVLELELEGSAKTPTVGAPVVFNASNSTDPDGEIASYTYDLDGDGVPEFVDAGPAVEYTYAEAGTYRTRLVVVDDDGASDEAFLTVTVEPPANEPPTASFVFSPRDPDPGAPVSFDASGSSDPDGTVASYEWFVDGNATARATGPKVILAFAEERSYDVTLVVTDDGGATGALTDAVGVGDALPADNEPPRVDFSFSPALPTAGDSVRFSANASDPDGSVVGYAWQVDGGGVASDPGFTRVFPSAGAVAVALTVVDDEGTTATRTRTVTVAAGNDPPVAAFSYGPYPATEGRLTFDASASSDPDGSIASYAWDLDGDGSVDATGAGGAPTVGFDYAPGEYAVTLTVTDDDGAVATRSTALTVAPEPNEPPAAAFVVDPLGPEPGDEVTFDATGSTDADGSIASYAWTVDGTAVGTGRQLTYTFPRQGTVEVGLTVTDDDGAADAEAQSVQVLAARARPTVSVQVSDVPEFTVRRPRRNVQIGQDPYYYEGVDLTPGRFVVGEAIEFDAGASTAPGDRTITGYGWIFDDGTLANGRVVTHGFASAGTRVVGVLVTDSRGRFAFERIEVLVAPPGAFDLDRPYVQTVTPDRKGLALSGVGLDVTYTASVFSGADLDRVEFTLGSRTRAGTRTGAGQYAATFDVGRLTRDATLEVRAVDVNGNATTETLPVRVVTPKPWLAALIDRGTATVSERTVGGQERTIVTIRARVPDPAIGFDVDTSGLVARAIGSRQYARLASETTIEYDMRTARIELAGRGDLVGEVVKRPFEGFVEVEGTVDGTTYDLRRGVLTAGARMRAFQQSFVVDLGGIVGRTEFTVYVDPTLEAQAKFAADPDLRVREGTIQPGVEAGVKFDFSIVDGEVYGGVAGTIVLPGYDVGLSAFIGIRGTVYYLVGEEDFDLRFDGSIGAEPLALAGADRLGDGWYLPETHSGSPPGVDSDGDVARTLGLDAAPQAVVDAPTTGRLTTDTVQDRAPAVAYGNGSYTSVWSRQNTARNASAGRDVYLSSAVGGDGWTAPVALTDDEKPDAAPAIAADGDRRLVAWTRVNGTFGADFGGLDGAYRRAEVAYALDDGTGFSVPALLTGDSAADTDVVVAASGGRWLVAWIRDADADLGTVADRDGRYAVIGADGTPGAVRPLPNATAVAVAADTGGFALAYLESEDGANGTVVRGHVARSVFDGRERIAVTRLTGLAVAPGRLAWVAGPVADPTVRYARDGAPVVVPTNATDVRDLALVVDGGRPVLAYRGRAPSTASVAGDAGGPTPGYELYYQLRGDDGAWLAERRLAGDAGTGLTFGEAGHAAGPEGFVAVFGARNVSTEDNPDLFAVTHRFGPDLTVTATPTPAAPLAVGSNVTLDLVVENAGDLPTSRATALTVDGGAGTLATVPVGRLAVGERTTATVEAAVDASGRLTATVDPNGAVAEVDETNNAVTVRLARPDLALGAVERTRVDGDLVVRATVANRGGVPSNATTVTLRSNGSTVATAPLAALAAGEDAVVELVAPVDALARNGRVAVATARADADPANDARGLVLLAVDLGVAPGLRYYAAEGGVRVELAVTNADLGAATAAVTVETADATATYRVPVPGATEPGAVRFERVSLLVADAAVNETLNVSVAAVGAVDANPAGERIESAVFELEPAGNATGGGLEATGLSVPDAPDRGAVPVTVTVANPGGVAAGAPVTVALDGRPVANATVGVGPAGTATVTLNLSVERGSYELAATVEDSTTTTTLTVGGGATAPDVSGDGRPARDLDGDGLFEDVTGDGRLNVIDVGVLLDEFDRPAVQNSAALFDFDGSGGVNIVDVAVLLDQT